MGELTTGVNWLAVIVGAVVAFGVGWLWYSPKLFGKKWAEGIGISLDSADAMPKAAMGYQAIGTFFLAWLFGITAVSNALLTIILVVFTIMALQAASGYFAKKSGYAIATETGFVFVMGVIMFVAQAVFRNLL
jgi:hypothetical protein